MALELRGVLTCVGRWATANGAQTQIQQFSGTAAELPVNQLPVLPQTQLFSGERFE